jgi:prepilin-type N-terminal cleavage/methylation domain-containing protein
MSKQDHPIVHRPETGNRRRCRGHACRAGFTIVECLISLAITAILLTAVAVAFNASVINYGENEQMYKTINNARQALTRMTSELRTGSTFDLSAGANECNFFTATNQNIGYHFNSADKKLYLIVNPPNGPRYVLCNNVTAASFTKTPTDNCLDCKSIQISLTVRTGDFQRTLAAAAVIRRNLPF